jgi:hypothetical protein
MKWNNERQKAIPHCSTFAFLQTLIANAKKCKRAAIFQPHRLLSILTIMFIVLVINSVDTFAQVTFPKSPTIQHFTPQTINSQQTTPQTNNNISYNQQPTVPMGGNAQDIINQQNRQAMQMMGYQPPVVPPSDPALAHQFILQQGKATEQSKQQRQIAELNSLLRENDIIQPTNYTQTTEYLTKTKIYRQAFADIMNMQNGSQPFSLKKAIFIIENAYLDNSLKYETYNKQILSKTKLLKSIIQKEGIKPNNNLGKNYIIQKMFSERIVEYKDTVVYKVHKPYQYDFDDFKGETDWTKMFVTKLLKTGKGQCHSLPLLYLIFAEELKTKAWLSLAPEHSFVIFSDNALKNFYFYETTNGNSVTDNFMLESGFITSQALKNKIYLDTLDQNGLIASCLADLIMGYTDKFGYDDFMASMVESLLKIYPNSIQGQIFKADLIAREMKYAAKQKGLKSYKEFQQYPEINNLYVALQNQYDYIDGLGYMQMPKDRYAAWLLSLNDEKHKQEKQKLKTTLIGNVKRDN